ncbi:MAG TPA: phospholipase D-like domain-containing protein [Candidatus Saccharimonadales bacterium]|nr:phospholipase D-like domain-containing protein [Candidatus Saccharimonadales bacterium]
MHRRLMLLVAAWALVGVVAAGTLGATPVQAAGPTPGPTFNDPTGTESEQFAIMNKIMRAIDGVPSGGTIRMAFYSFTIEAFADRLIAAHKRGVNVKLLLDDHETWPAWTRVQTRLGKNLSAKSFAARCRGACLTENFPSILHTKTFMFSSTGGKSWVVMVSSANPTYKQARFGWNNGYTIVGSTVMYEAFKKNFEMMAAGARNPDQPTTSPDAYFTATSGKHKIYFFPKAGTGDEADTYYGILGNIKCTGVATGYGSDGRTTIRIAMYQWSDLRIRLAERLWALDDRGCKVSIMFDPWKVDPSILRTLSAPGGRNGGVTIVPASTDDDGNGSVDIMLHDKLLMIDGSYAGDTSAKIVFTGSANWTNNSLHYNDEYLLRIWDNAVFTSFLRHWEKLRAFARTVEGIGSPFADALAGRDRDGVRIDFERPDGLD